MVAIAGASAPLVLLRGEVIPRSQRGGWAPNVSSTTSISPVVHVRFRLPLPGAWGPVGSSLTSVFDIGVHNTKCVLIGCQPE